MKRLGLKSILALIAILILAVAIYLNKLKPNQTIKTETKPPISALQNESPQIISTKPDPLEDAIVSGADPFEITFSKPLENVPELKNRIEPKLEYKVELSQDRKTAKFIPLKPYNLGTTYTIFIQPDSKFDGGGKLDKEYIFHIQTVRYRGV